MEPFALTHDGTFVQACQFANGVLVTVGKGEASRMAQAAEVDGKVCVRLQNAKGDWPLASLSALVAVLESDEVSGFFGGTGHVRLIDGGK